MKKSTENMVKVVGKSMTYAPAAQLWLNEIQEYFDKGWKIHPKPTGRLRANFRGLKPYVYMVSPEYYKELVADVTDIPTFSKEPTSEPEKEAPEEDKVKEEIDSEKSEGTEDAKTQEGPEAKEEVTNDSETVGEETPEEDSSESGDSVEKEISDEDILKDLRKKEELIDFANERGIDVPDNLYIPNQIKAHIKEQL